MFCIQCKTAFSWKTGQVEMGVIHNPHYFELLRQGNIHFDEQRHHREHGGCGPMPYIHTIRRLLEGMPNVTQQEIYEFYRQCVHHRQVTLPRYVEVDRDIDNDRVDYLVGDLDEKKYKSKLYVRYERTLRKIEERQILESYVSIGEELFRNMTRVNSEKTLEQLYKLSDITYKAIVELDKIYYHQALLHPHDIIIKLA